MQKLRGLSSYKAQPVKRVWIEKPGKPDLRPLGIPTLYDRAVQALCLFALDPLAETSADMRSFGFRVGRSSHDAVEYLRLLCGARYGKRHVLEVDIRKFFDRISHDWILKHVPLNKHLLREFLKAPICDTRAKSEEINALGVPQGGVISPLIANYALDGLETLVSSVRGCFFVRYADDFVVVGNSAEDLTQVRSFVDAFLAERGLACHPDKTGLTTIEDGFDFLGFHMKEFKDPNRTGGQKLGILLIQPTASNIRRLKRRVSDICRTTKQSSGRLIQTLNPVLRGWAEYFRTVSSRKAFRSIEHHMFFCLYSWAKRKHRRLPRRTLVKLYWTKVKNDRWTFTGKDDKGQKITLFKIGGFSQRRHRMVLLRERFNPYLLEHKQYFERRNATDLAHSALLDARKRKLLTRQKGRCAHCDTVLRAVDVLHVHHVVPVKEGGSDTLKNLRVMHKSCHQQVHSRS